MNILEVRKPRNKYLLALLHIMRPKGYKISVVGDGGTGKSTLLTVKSTKKFDQTKSMTIGVDFTCIPIESESDSGYFFTFDLGGQSRFHFMHDAFILGTKAGIIVYDVTRFLSFDHIPYWLNLLHAENPQMPIIVVGSKIDLVSPAVVDQYRRNFEEMKGDIAYADQIIAHLMVSAKTNEGIDDLFTQISDVLHSSS